MNRCFWVYLLNLAACWGIFVGSVRHRQKQGNWLQAEGESNVLFQVHKPWRLGNPLFSSLAVRRGKDAYCKVRVNNKNTVIEEAVIYLEGK